MEVNTAAQTPRELSSAQNADGETAACQHCGTRKQRPCADVHKQFEDKNRLLQNIQHDDIKEAIQRNKEDIMKNLQESKEDIRNIQEAIRNIKQVIKKAMKKNAKKSEKKMKRCMARQFQKYICIIITVMVVFLTILLCALYSIHLEIQKIPENIHFIGVLTNSVTRFFYPKKLTHT